MSKFLISFLSPPFLGKQTEIINPKLIKDFWNYTCKVYTPGGKTASDAAFS